MIAMTRDPEALEEVIQANPGERIVFSYSSDLYLNRPISEIQDDNQDESEEKDKKSQD